MSSRIADIFAKLSLTLPKPGALASENPANGEIIASVELQSLDEAHEVTGRATAAFTRWRQVPAPVRGEAVRKLGEVLRKHKEPLAQLICLEIGKGIAEARGEVQEMIDICDYATGISRTIGGSTLFSERPSHRMFEQWHPLGPVLCITAFNFPMAVWAWNAAIALICGDPIVWKPSLKAPLCAVAVHQIAQPIFAAIGHPDVLGLVIAADNPVSVALVADKRYPLVSATGSCRMGQAVGSSVAARMGRSLLELGGNNAIIVDKTANLELAARAILFGAAGTAGQRCTTTRRLFVEASVYDDLKARLIKGYNQMQTRVGDPSDENNLIGPLIDEGAAANFTHTLAEVVKQDGKILAGGNRLARTGYYVQPTLVEVPHADFPPMKEETFAPILYLCKFAQGGLASAIAAQNNVEQGLSSAIFSDSVLAVETFLGTEGSDCGIANVNIGTSGAEIGGAFGGEKATGGGRESGSDSWKAYMRRQTCTVNGSSALPLAQGIVWE